MQLSTKSSQRWVLGKLLKHELHACSFFGMSHQALVFIAVAKRNNSAVPQTFRGPLLHLVSGAVCSHLSFKLGKVEEDVSEQSSHRMVRIKTLGNRHELRAVAVE
ncbi:MAG: hypothetical protein R3B11_05970 [Nitrospira sp.]|nr:hypothetical protein [Nitrospira sp.]